MSLTVTVDEAQSQLKELIRRLAPGDDIIITDRGQPIAKLIGDRREVEKSPRSGPGLFKGIITYMAPDFDAPLDDMKEYL